MPVGMGVTERSAMARKDKPCPWPGDDPLYLAYHDREWGVVNNDERALFEKLILEGFQAGLSWITILRKRENFRIAFAGFEAEKIARFSDRKIDRLMQNPAIIRNRAKIEAARSNARAFLKLSEKQSLSDFLWDFLDGQPIENRFRTMQEVPASTPLSKKISQSLKSHGFRFVGPKSVYAFMQSMGFTNDHLVTCRRHGECARIAREFSLKGRVSASQGHVSARGV